MKSVIMLVRPYLSLLYWPHFNAGEKFTFNALRALDTPTELIMDCPGVNYYVSKESHDARAWFKDFLPNVCSALQTVQVSPWGSIK